MRRPITTFLLLALLPLAACLTVVTGATRTEPHARPPRPDNYPIELLKQDVPERPHKVIGSVRARVKLSESRSRVAPPSAVIAALKQEARALGGDALLPITVTPVTGGGTYVSPGDGVLIGNSEIWSALVIVWLQP
jgi:hypothetical protein